LVGTVLTSLFSKEIASSVDNFILRIKDITGETQKQMVGMKQEAIDLLKDNDVGYGMGNDAQKELLNF